MGNLAPLGALSGAAGGMADAVAGIIEQRLRQAQVANQTQQTLNQAEEAKARLAETANQNAAMNQYRADSLQATIENKIAVENDTKARNQATAASQYQGMLKTLPTGTRFTDQGYQTALSKGAIPEQFGVYQPPTMGMSTPTGEQGPAPEGRPFLGIQSELDKANKQPPSENLAQLRVEVSGILAKPPATRTPEENAKVAGYKGLKDVEGEQAMQRLQISVGNANTRQDKGFTNAAQEKAHYDLQKTIDAQPLPQAAKIVETLNAPGGVNDAIAVPQFLSALAGGSGSGLRMTQAELNLIQKARPTTESIGVKLNNLAGNYQALTAQQRKDMLALVRSIAEREVRVSDLYTATQARVDAAKSPDEVLQHMNRLNSAQTQMYRGLIGANGPTPTPTQPTAQAPGTLPTDGQSGVAGGLQWRVKPPSD